MMETILWIALAVVMYFAGRYDAIAEFSAGPWNMEFLDAHTVRFTRPKL